MQVDRIEKVKISEGWCEKIIYIPSEDAEKENIIFVLCGSGEAKNIERSKGMVISYKDESDEKLKFFNQMLSTFKFIE
jgi:hypothetical protein